VTLDAVVLAGGAATRFGGDKLAAAFHGATVLGRAVEAAASAGGRVVVVLGPDDPAPDLPSISIARDAVAHRGPLAGLQAGLEALPGAEDVLVLAGDMPEIRVAVLNLLIETLRREARLAAVHLEGDPVPTLPLAARASVVLPAARALLAADRRSLRALLDTVPSRAVPSAEWRAVDPEGRTLRDVDTPADLDR
jgi:molybdopterin-guanine dinucleotide biosynthesis protein A